VDAQVVGQALLEGGDAGVDFILGVLVRGLLRMDEGKGGVCRYTAVALLPVLPVERYGFGWGDVTGEAVGISKLLWRSVDGCLGVLKGVFGAFLAFFLCLDFVLGVFR